MARLSFTVLIFDTDPELDIMLREASRWSSAFNIRVKTRRYRFPDPWVWCRAHLGRESSEVLRHVQTDVVVRQEGDAVTGNA